MGLAPAAGRRIYQRQTCHKVVAGGVGAKREKLLSAGLRRAEKRPASPRPKRTKRGGDRPPGSPLPAPEGRGALRILGQSGLWLPSYEAHLPAEKAQASAYPRFPITHVYAWRTSDPEAPTGQGAQAPHSMTAQPPARPRSGRARLSRSGDFDRVIRRGRSHASRELVLYVFPRPGDGETRLGLSVSRKVGGAVERNRVKRLLREAFAHEQAALPAGTDVVVVARQEAGPLAEREGLAGIRGVLAQLIGEVREGSPA